VNGAWSRDYIRDGKGNLIATENASGPCTPCYFSYDHLGSVRLVTDQNGLIVARHDYLPYGEEVSGYSGRTMTGFSVAGTAPNDATQKFTGQVRDQESGMDYFNARYLTPVFGRFNSPDPQNAGASLLSSQSWNGYAYVGGNPLNSVDPSGMDPCTAQNNYCGKSFLFNGGSNNTGFSNAGVDYNEFGILSMSTAQSNTPSAIIVPIPDETQDPNFGTYYVLYPANNGIAALSTWQSAFGLSYYGGSSGAPKNPKLPACDDAKNNRSRFFQQLPGISTMAQQLNVPRDYLTGLASFESGWLDNHNFALNNMWGLTQAGGNNLSFPSIQAGNNYFSTHVGPYIQGAQTLPAFFDGLQKEGYNAVNPNYYSLLAGRIGKIPLWEAACNVN